MRRKHKSDGDGLRLVTYASESAPSQENDRALPLGSAKERSMVVFPTRRLCELEASTVQAQGVAGHR
jgi:hypothetical protein